MQCLRCDGVIPDDAQFCIYCGAAVVQAQTGPTRRLTADPPVTVDPGMAFGR